MAARLVMDDRKSVTYFLCLLSYGICSHVVRTSKKLPSLLPQKTVQSATRPIFFLRSIRNEVDLPSYESKMTDKQEQNDWTDEKNLDG